MKRIRCLSAVAGSLCLLAASVSPAAALFDTVQLVADTAVASNPVPPAQTFTISEAGSYTVTLTDLQLPTALASLSLAIANSTSLAVALNAAGTKTVSLQPGTYTVQVLALAASGAAGGAFGAQVTPASGGAAVWQYADAIGAANPAPTTGQSVLSTTFTVTTSGTYQLTLADLDFPVALSSLHLIVLNDCGTTVGCTSTPVAGTPISGSTSAPVPLSLVPGTYDLFVVATADSTALQGLYTVQIAGPTAGSTLYVATVPVGQLPPPSSIAIPANGSVSVQLLDLATPAALSSIQAVVTEGSTVLAQASSAGTLSFAATTGTAQLYVIAQPGTGGQGSYEAYVTAGATTLADIVQPVLASGSYGYAFATTLSAGGNDELSVYDFQLPTAFASLSAAVVQAGAILTTSQGSSSFTAQSGPLNVLVFPAFPAASAASANGLFSVQISGQSTGVTEYETTQGVGALFSSQTVTVATAGSYTLTLTDLGFPANFSTLAVIATRGDSLAGQVFGGGKLAITATPGTYILNVLAQVGTGVDYGLYGVQLGATPPAPTVTLTASSSAVSSGKSVTLSWSSTATTSCTASATPTSTTWTGTLPSTSGSVSSGALTGTTAFSISCTGTDGTVGTASTSVNVTAAKSSGSSHGGGGSVSIPTLLALTLASILQLARRRARLRNWPRTARIYNE